MLYSTASSSCASEIPDLLTDSDSAPQSDSDLPAGQATSSGKSFVDSDDHECYPPVDSQRCAALVAHADAGHDSDPSIEFSDSSEDADSEDSATSDCETDLSSTCSDCDVSIQPQAIGSPAIAMTTAPVAGPTATLESQSQVDPKPDLDAETDPEPGELPEDLPGSSQFNGFDGVAGTE